MDEESKLLESLAVTETKFRALEYLITCGLDVYSKPAQTALEDVIQEIEQQQRQHVTNALFRSWSKS